MLINLRRAGEGDLGIRQGEVGCSFLGTDEEDGAERDEA